MAFLSFFGTASAVLPAAPAAEPAPDPADPAEGESGCADAAPLLIPHADAVGLPLGVFIRIGTGAAATPSRDRESSWSAGFCVSWPGDAFLGAGIAFPVGFDEPLARRRPLLRKPPEALLENPRRRGLHEAVRETPGLHASGLARLVGVSRVVAQHHLRALVAHGLVRERRVGRFTHYFPADAPPDAPDLVAALRDPTRRRLAQALAGGDGPQTQRTLAARTGLAQTLVSYHLRILEAAGLVEAEGRLPRLYRPAPALLAFPWARGERAAGGSGEADPDALGQS